MAEPTTGPLVVATGLDKVFGSGHAAVHAVDHVDLSVEAGTTVGVVGESGSGKSTLARLLLRLVEPTSGSVRFDGTELLDLGPAQLRRWRRRTGMVFQNQYSSLLSGYSAAANVAEPLRINKIGTKQSRLDDAVRLLELVGLPARAGRMYPRQLSGGQQQRVAIARALALQPDLLVCDEPTSALDVSIQAQILALFERLQAELGFAMLFITHNLAVAERLADRIVVMRRGRVVESAPTRALFDHPQHAYTRTLLEAVLPVREDALTSVHADRPTVVDDAEHALVEVAPGHLARGGASPRPDAVAVSLLKKQPVLDKR